MNVNVDCLKDFAKSACHSLWIKKDFFIFKNYCTSDVDIVGFSDSDTVLDGNFDGVNFFPYLANTSVSYDIAHEDYKVSSAGETASIVMCELTISLTKANEKKYIRVFATFVIKINDNKPLIFNAHFSTPDLVDNNHDLSQNILPRTEIRETEDTLSSYYRHLIEENCDLFIELDSANYELTYDKAKYNTLFDDDTFFTNPDRWFWHMCNTCVHPEDYERIDIFRKIDIEKRMRANIDTVETSFRIKNRLHGYIWVKMQTIYKYKNQTDIEKMALIFRKVDSTQFNELEYIEKSRRDDLTGLYNKKYSEYLINSFIENYNQQQICAFIVVDIDNFRQVNDTFGHLTGDNILIQFSRSLNSFFCNGDIIGRINGDKFFILSKNMPSQYEVTKSIDNFLKSMHHTHCELGTSLDIHCSAGIVFLDDAVKSFDELYTRGMDALHKSKENGKNCYFIAP